MAAFSAAALAAGCGDSNRVERYPLTGAISYEGKPIPAGWIVLAPDSGPGASADIIDGRFETPPGYGSIGGPHTIEVVAMQGFEVADSTGDDQGAAALDSSAGRSVFKCKIRRDIPREASEIDIRITADEIGVKPGQVEF